MKLGDKLYRYADLGKVFEYTVVGKIDRGNGEKLELRCENCNDHDGCLVIVQQNGTSYVYKEMSHQDDQYFWHNDGFYRSTKQAALSDMYKRMIANHKQGIETAQKNIDFHNEHLKRIEELLKAKDYMEGDSEVYKGVKDAVEHLQNASDLLNPNRE